MQDLASGKCRPCEGGIDPIGPAEAADLLQQLNDGWRLVRDSSVIERSFRFPSYARTLAFVNAVAFVATNEGHHPEIEFTYGSCRVRYWTTAIDGLSINDFICAAKIDRLAEET